jgi:hypothetical protein
MKVVTYISAISIYCNYVMVDAFTAAFSHQRTIKMTTTTLVFSTEAAMAEAGVPPAHSDATANVKDDVEIPTNLPSDVNMDYIPLATMLATGQLAEADQVREIHRIPKTGVCSVS